jgi:hypothetical protein
MRVTLALLAALTVCSFSSPAKADQIKWCAIYGSGHGGQNCGFYTWEQCRATIAGDNRATCVPNPFYDGRPARRIYR